MISKKVHDELMSVRRVLHYLPVSPSTEYGWTPHERQIFWLALDRFPRGPWTVIAEFIGTKSTRQAMTHGQKLRQKLKRWVTRLHGNPTARILMNGVVATSVVNMTQSSAAVSAPRRGSLVGLPGPGFSARTVHSTPQLLTRQDKSADCVSEDDQHERLHQENEQLNHCITSAAMQAKDKGASSSVCGEDLGFTSSHVQMLFDLQPPAVNSDLHAAPIDFGESKQSNPDITLHPIREDPIPDQNLIDELADALWSDYTGESKELGC